MLLSALLFDTLLFIKKRHSYFFIDFLELLEQIKNVKKEKQLYFKLFEGEKIKHFGGMYLKNSNAKEKRPVSLKRSMHLVLRSSLAKKELSLLRKERIITDILNRQARLHGVKIYRNANGGNHLHLIIKPKSREAYKAFIRSISGLIARTILGAERAKKKGLKFWDKRPFTRIVEWGKEFKLVCNYLIQNSLEAYGFIPYQRQMKEVLFKSTA